MLGTTCYVENWDNRASLKDTQVGNWGLDPGLADSITQIFLLFSLLLFDEIKTMMFWLINTFMFYFYMDFKYFYCGNIFGNEFSVKQRGFAYMLDLAL